MANILASHALDHFAHPLHDIFIEAVNGSNFSALFRLSIKLCKVGRGGSEIDTCDLNGLPPPAEMLGGAAVRSTTGPREEDE